MSLLDAKQAVKKCQRCGKAPGAKGSLTSWIFRETVCNCSVRVKPDQNSQKLPLAQSPISQLGTVFPNFGPAYEVLHEIGQGGMGTVYKARDKASDKLYAIKVLRPELVADEPSIKRFEKEVAAISLLSHPNLVTVLKSGRDQNGAPYMVMEYIDGISLADVLKQEGTISVRRTISIMYQICEALSHSHAKGVIHRDLKPSNIILTSDANGAEEVKLVDFGIAKVIPSVQQQTQDLTQSGEIFGSPLYMSPEQCTGKELDARSDVYSLGCVMYESLCGHPPFSGENVIQTILKHILDDPAELPSLKDPDLTPDLRHVVMKCLLKKPDDRYSSARELMRDLLSVGLNKPLSRLPRGSKKLSLSILGTLPVLIIAGFLIWGIVERQTQAPESSWNANDAKELGQSDEVDPEVRILLKGLLDAGATERATNIESAIARCLNIARTHGNLDGSVVVGKVVVNGPDHDNPDAVVTQTPVEGGYFVSPVGDLKKPIAFRLHGYTPVDVNLGDLKLTHRVSWIGRITLDKLPENATRKLEGTVSGDNGFDPSTAKIEVSIAPYPTNTPGNEYQSEGLQWQTVIIHPDKSGHFEVPGCSPTFYIIAASAPGRAPYWEWVNLRRAAPLSIVLDRSKLIDVSYIAKEARDLSSLRFTGKAVSKTVIADERFPSRDDLVITQKDGKLGFSGAIHRHFRAHMNPCALEDLGSGDLSQFSNEILSRPVLRPDKVEFKDGHVYLFMGSFPSAHYVLFSVSVK